MPIYEFECAGCGHRFDRLQKLSEDDPTMCPGCGAAQVKRRVSAPSFRLAGSGWYETDFKSDSDKKRNLADSKSAGDGGASAKPESSEKSAAAAAPAPAAPAPAPAAAPPSGGSAA